MNIETVQNIYDKISDEISKKIFMARINFLLTNNEKFVLELSDDLKTLNPEILSFKKQLLEISQMRTVIFGAGANGTSFARQLLKGNVVAFIDNYSDMEFDEPSNIPIFRLKNYVDKFGIKDTEFIISVKDRAVSRSMYEQLREYNVRESRIIIAPFDYRNNYSQYFDVFAPNENESFVDCGAYDGSTSFYFVGWCGNKGYDRIWCFEPDLKSYENVKANCSKLTNCDVFRLGLSDVAAEVPFVNSGVENAHILADNKYFSYDNKIKTVKLDDFIKNEKVTFIKMDIEGAEYNALKGAENIIKTQKPRLAISVYHRKDDIIKIPQMLLKFLPEYKFIIRHYSLLTNETILYAYT